MTEIEIVTILISSIALIISVLGYLDNRRKLKIVLERESERKDIKRAIEVLKTTSDELKNLPQHINFGHGAFLLENILQEVYEGGELNLRIEYKNLDTYGGDGEKKYPIDSINAEMLRNNIYNSCTLEYNSRPNVILNEFFEFGDFFHGLAEIDKNLNQLKEFESIVDSFDGEIIKIIDKGIQEILELLSDALKKEIYNLEFNRNMKPSEIENKIYGITNYTLILEKAKILSTDTASRVDGLRSKLFEMVLTK